MAVLIESSIWEPSPALYIFIFFCCFFSVSLFPRDSKNSNNSNRIPSVLDKSISPSLLRFRCNFLLLYSLASVMEGLWSVFGEFELAHYEVTKEQMAFSICVGLAAAFFLGPFLRVLSDLIKPRARRYHKEFGYLYSTANFHFQAPKYGHELDQNHSQRNSSFIEAIT